MRAGAEIIGYYLRAKSAAQTRINDGSVSQKKREPVLAENNVKKSEREILR